MGPCPYNFNTFSLNFLDIAFVPWTLKIKKKGDPDMKKSLLISALAGGSLVLSLLAPYHLWAQDPLPAQEPVVMLIQAKGHVSYTTDQKTWKRISRNKFLYDGWGVKTEQDATCKLLLLQQDSNKMEVLSSNTRVVIDVAGTQVLSGTITEHESASSLPGQLKRKLARMQKYTTVSRKDRSKDRPELDVADTIRLGRRFPDLAWENVGKEYSYRLIVDETLYEVPAADTPVVRFTLPEQKPGKHDYEVQVLYKGEVYHTPDKGGHLIWMSDAQEKELDEKIKKLQQVDGNNGYLLGNLLDDEGVKVAAMDQYAAYIKSDPDANEVRPFLVKVLYELGLKDMRQKQALLFWENSGKPKE